MGERKITYNKVMTLRDYANLAYFLETGEYERDFTGCDQKALKESKKYSLRLTKEDKKLVDKFFSRFKLGISADSIFDTIPKEKVVAKPVIIQQQPIAPVVAAPINTVAAPAAADPYSVSLSTPPVPTMEETVEYPVYSDDERWELAEALEREPNESVVDKFNYKITDKSPYYFIKNLNKPVNSLENFEPMLALKMIFDGKVTPLEVSKVCGAEGSFIFAMNSREMPNLHPDFVQKYIQFTPACMDMWELGKQYRYMMKHSEENADEKEILHRYALVMRRELEPIKDKEIKGLSNQFIEKIIAVRGDTITLSSNDDDVEEQDIVDIKYDNSDDLKNDFMILAGNYDFDPKKQVDIFGKTTTYEKVTKEFMKKYPHAISGRFFRTTKEAFIEGSDKIGGIIGVDFQWRVER